MAAINIEGIRKLDYRSNEAYKNLRTNIQLCGSDVKVIMVTSATPNEGKSSVSFNLAVSLAESGKKVIFIDADLRKSILVGRYKINKSVKGLTHFLSGICKFEEVMYATNVENLLTVFSGPVPPNPSELLGNKTFKLLIKTLRETYDYVIIDTPPLGNVIDSAIVAQECDGAIFVIAANTISYKFIQNTMVQLKKTDCKILGAVLNKVDMSENGYYSKYYGKYYGKY
ncbi:polysaccharide biosynthesis tyrosine autokinase [[Clostridium] fimetarium]|uniref:non-specific protein-tyrosine kinase n=1 Tax=[Clostridium] fimetarium TaxID=99656 RepID=A0A1I0RLX5_9FIRM|nr:polysaccharide biosynthesis tyrosine autokinase [[Clostridium] fimetarium]SEW41931.1 capsular exopolysaccharide family [[Clostridium] fimetarium]